MELDNASLLFSFTGSIAACYVNQVGLCLCVLNDMLPNLEGRLTVDDLSHIFMQLDSYIEAKTRAYGSL